MRSFTTLLIVFAAFLLSAGPLFAQAAEISPAPAQATTTASDAFSQLLLGTTTVQDLTKPEGTPAKDDIHALFERRPITAPDIFNAFAYWVQYAVRVGVPANTIVLILLMPVIATLVTFTRVVIGLPSLEIFVPIVLAYAFVAVGVTLGLLILGAIVFASFASRTLLRRVPIMLLPKRSLSHLILAACVFGALTAATTLRVAEVQMLSIFPVLILTLLGDSIVSVQLRKDVRDTLVITVVTIGLGLIGYMLAISPAVRDALLLWPELVLLLIPVNFLIGRYFGLRLIEVFRFRALESYGGK